MRAYLSAFLEATYCETRDDHTSILRIRSNARTKEPFGKGLKLGGSMWQALSQGGGAYGDVVEFALQFFDAGCAGVG